MEEKRTIKNLLIIMNILLLLVIGTILIPKQYYVEILLIFTVILQCYSLFKFRNNNIYFLFNVFIISYYIVLLKGYLFNIPLTPHRQNFLGQSDEKCVIIYCLFYISIIIVFFMAKKNNNNNGINSVKCYQNYLIYYFCIFMTILFILLGHKSFNFGSGYNKSSTIFNEYIIVWFFLSLIYADTKNKKRIVIIIFIINSIINFLLGDRISVLQIGILMFIMLFNNKFNYKKLIVAILFVYLIFGIVDATRANKDFKISTFFNKRENVEMINNNQAEVFNSAITIIRLIDDKRVNELERKKAFIGYYIRIFVPQNKLSELSNLSGYAKKYYVNQGGGFIAAYWYVWLGWLGVIIVGLAVGLVLYYLNVCKKNNNIAIFTIMFISVMPRWLAYDPIQMFKIPIITIILYLIITRISSKKIKSKL